jgi:AraC-like DNA-binding protein
MDRANCWDSTPHHSDGEGTDAALTGFCLERQQALGRQDPMEAAQAIRELYRREQFNFNARQALDDLRRACLTFRANRRVQEEVEVLLQIVTCLRAQGFTQTCLAVADHALQAKELTATARLEFNLERLLALAHMLRFDEASELADRTLLPAILGKSGVAPRADWWSRMGCFRLKQYCRAMNLDCSTTLDIHPSRPPDLSRAQELLAEAASYAARAQELNGKGQCSERLQLLTMSVKGYAGDLESAARIFRQLQQGPEASSLRAKAVLSLHYAHLLAANGRVDEAYSVVGAVVPSAESVGLGVLHSASYLQARLAQQLGAFRASMVSYQRFVQLNHDIRRTDDQWLLDEVKTCGADLPFKLSPQDIQQLKVSIPPYLHQAERIISQNLKNPPTIESLAAQLGITRRTLESAMRRYEGKTPTEWVRGRRMQQARDMLQYTSLTLKQIADEIGYAHLTSFSRDFKKVFGQAPSVMRRVP